MPAVSMKSLTEVLGFVREMGEADAAKVARLLDDGSMTKRTAETRAMMFEVAAVCLEVVVAEMKAPTNDTPV